MNVLRIPDLIAILLLLLLLLLTLCLGYQFGLILLILEGLRLFGVKRVMR